MTEGHQDLVAAVPAYWPPLMETVYQRQSIWDVYGPENDFTENFAQKLQATQSCPQPFAAWQRIPVLLPSHFAQTRRMNSICGIHLMSGGLTSM